MTKVNYNSYDGKDLIKKADNSIGTSRITEIRNGGKHPKIYGVNEDGTKSMMTCPHHIKGTGTKCAIIKWLLGMGVSFGLILAYFILL